MSWVIIIVNHLSLPPPPLLLPLPLPLPLQPGLFRRTRHRRHRARCRRRHRWRRRRCWTWLSWRCRCCWGSAQYGNRPSGQPWYSLSSLWFLTGRSVRFWPLLGWTCWLGRQSTARPGPTGQCDASLEILDIFWLSPLRYLILDQV